MADFMSDKERMDDLRSAMAYIREAMSTQRAVTRLRKLYEKQGVHFGDYGSTLDDMLADGDVQFEYARTILNGIDSKAQPIIQAGTTQCPFVGFSDSAASPRTITLGLGSHTDLPSGGTVLVSNAEDDENNGLYTVDAKDGTLVLEVSGTVSNTMVANGSDESALLTWTTY